MNHVSDSIRYYREGIELSGRTYKCHPTVQFSTRTSHALTLAGIAQSGRTIHVSAYLYEDFPHDQFDLLVFENQEFTVIDIFKRANGCVIKLERHEV